MTAPSLTSLAIGAAIGLSLLALAVASCGSDRTYFVTKMTDHMVFVQRSDGDSRICLVVGRPQANDNKAPLVIDTESQAHWDAHNLLNARLAVNCSFWQ